MTMLKPKTSLSPEKTGHSHKRSREMSPVHEKKVKHSKSHHHVEAEEQQEPEQQGEPRFTFEEVVEMIDKMLAKQTRASAAVSAELRRVNFEEVAAEGHSVEGCKDLIEKLVHNTRRVRTLSEVLLDIKENLKKRSYTEIIHRASLKTEDLPKKPPSAYLLYHQDRYNELRDQNSLAVEVSKIVAEEWKVLSAKKRREYQRRHDELARKYEEDMERLGLYDEAAPKRPKSAKFLYIDHCIQRDEGSDEWPKEYRAQKKEEYGQQFENLDPESKNYWSQLHKEKQQQYLQEREEYIAAHPHLNHAVPEKKSRAREKVSLPEPPKNALKFYIQKKMPSDLTGKEYDEKKKLLKAKFASLSEKKLLKYIKKAVLDKERYDKEVAAFKLKYPDRDIGKTKNNISREQMKLFSKMVENRPSMPAPNAYLHYCGKMLSDMHDQDDDFSPTRRMQNASVAWRECSPREKSRAVQEHLMDIERYIEQMEAWLANQTEERKNLLMREEPKANPDWWRKRLSRWRRVEKRKIKVENDALAYMCQGNWNLP